MFIVHATGQVRRERPERTEEETFWYPIPSLTHLTSLKKKTFRNEDICHCYQVKRFIQHWHLERSGIIVGLKKPEVAHLDVNVGLRLGRLRFQELGLE
jgi:hypothetical protein